MLNMNNKDYINPYGMFKGISVPGWLLRQKHICPKAKIVYGTLVGFAGKNGKCYPKASHISEESGIPEKTVKTKINELKRLDLIETKKRGFGLGNDYFFKKSPLMGLEDSSNHNSAKLGTNEKIAVETHNSAKLSTNVITSGLANTIQAEIQAEPASHDNSAKLGITNSAKLGMSNTINSDQLNKENIDIEEIEVIKEKKETKKRKAFSSSSEFKKQNSNSIPAKSKIKEIRVIESQENVTNNRQLVETQPKNSALDCLPIPFDKVPDLGSELTEIRNSALKAYEAASEKQAENLRVDQFFTAWGSLRPGEELPLARKAVREFLRDNKQNLAGFRFEALLKAAKNYSLQYLTEEQLKYKTGAGNWLRKGGYVTGFYNFLAQERVKQEQAEQEKPKKLSLAERVRERRRKRKQEAAEKEFCVF